MSAKLVLGARLTPADIAALCRHAERLLADDTVDMLVCDASAAHRPDATTVDALAQLHVTARRMGGAMRLRGCSRELDELIALMGLTDVLGT